jgi:acrylyl-CoA reductase (NADPH)
LLRGINLLGIDSVMQPFASRQEAWLRLAKDLDKAKLESMIEPARLSDLPRLGRSIVRGQVRGRVVVDVHAD